MRWFITETEGVDKCGTAGDGINSTAATPERTSRLALFKRKSILAHQGELVSNATHWLSDPDATD